MRSEYEELQESPSFETRRRKVTILAMLSIVFLVIIGSSIVSSGNDQSLAKKESLDFTIDMPELDEYTLQVAEELFQEIGNPEQVVANEKWHADGKEKSFVHVVPRPASNCDSMDCYDLIPTPFADHIGWCDGALQWLMHNRNAHVFAKTIYIRNGHVHYHEKKVFVLIVTSPHGERHLFLQAQRYCHSRHTTARPRPPMSTRHIRTSSTHVRMSTTTKRPWWSTSSRPPWSTSSRPWQTTRSPWHTTRRTTRRSPGQTLYTRSPWHTTRSLGQTTRRWFGTRSLNDKEE